MPERMQVSRRAVLQGGLALAVIAATGRFGAESAAAAVPSTPPPPPRRRRRVPVGLL